MRPVPVPSFISDLFVDRVARDALLAGSVALFAAAMDPQAWSPMLPSIQAAVREDAQLETLVLLASISASGLILLGGAVGDSRRARPVILGGLAVELLASVVARILSIRMRPMSLSERGVAAPSVSLEGLLTGARSPLAGETALRAADYAHEIVGSGLPGIRGIPARTARAQLDAHISRIIDRDYTELGGERLRNPVALRRWLASYAAGVSTTSSLETIRDGAAGSQGQAPSRATVQRYLDVLERLWLIEPVPGWAPASPRFARLTAAPKHQLTDPALAARLLGVGAGAMLASAPSPAGIRHPEMLLGALFESLATLSVRVFAQAAEARVFHYRTQRGEREVDLIVERDDQRFVAIEVKSAQAVSDDDGKHLRRLQEQAGDAMLDAIIVSTGTRAYRRKDGIGVVPLSLLGE